MSKSTDIANAEARIAEMAERLAALAATVDSLSRDNESLAAQAAEAQRDTADAMRAVAAVTAERDEALAQRDMARAELDRVVEQIKIANARLYAPRTEKVPPEQMSLYLQLFNGAEADADPSVPDPDYEDAVAAPRRERRRGGKRRLDYESMQTVVIDHELPADMAGCPECGSGLADFKVEVTRTVKLVPAHLVVEEHRRHVYICKECSKANAAGEEAPVAIVRAPMPKMALHKALSYADAYWPHVMRVLEDGRLELSNNLAENAIRPFVIGRKNHLFSDVPRGAAASAAIYSIVVTAGANGLNQRLYMEWLLAEMPNDGHLREPGGIDRYLPWSEEVPDACRLSAAEAAKLAEMPDDPIIDIDPEPFDEV